MYFKGFDKDLQCIEVQFEVGKEYDTGKGALKLCTDTVFHFCDSIQKVHRFYRVDNNSRFCEIEVLGELVQDDEKMGSNRIKIVREIVGDELNILIGKINGNTGVFNSGHRNAGDYNSGGYNSGYYNAGDYNSGYYNAGGSNAGGSNSGNSNSGGSNAGDYNSGYYNSGDFNACDWSSGFFCDIEPKARVFNHNISMTVSEFRNSKYYDAMVSSSFILTEYLDDKLVTYRYKEACQKWWDNMDKDNQKIILSIPGFDKKVFENITGIKVI